MLDRLVKFWSAPATGPNMQSLSKQALSTELFLTLLYQAQVVSLALKPVHSVSS